MKRFRGGFVLKAHRLVYHSTLGWRVMTTKKKSPSFRNRFRAKMKYLKAFEHQFSEPEYRGTSLIRNILLLGPYSTTMLRALWWS